MKKVKFTQIMTFGFILLVLFISSISVSANSDDWTRTSSAEGVSLEIKLVNSAEMDSEELLFEVYLSTHSGNLLDNNFEELITVRNDQGYLNNENIDWEWERESSHHPIGLIKIKNATIDGQKFYSDKTEYLELEINGIREESHRFRWNINQNKKLLSYIPNAADGTVSVMDIDAEKVINTIEVGEEASHGIEITPDGRFLYTGDFQNGLIKIFDLSSNELIKTLEVNSTAHGIDMSPDGKYILVASGSESEVAVIDTAKQEIVKVIEEGIGDSPSHIDFDPVGKYAILTNLESDDVSVISIPDFEVTVRIPVGDGPNEGRVAPDGRYAYTANRKTNDVAIIDAETRQIERYIDAGEYANHLEFTPDGKKVVVTNARDNEAILIDTETYEVISRIQLGEEPHEISFLIK